MKKFLLFLICAVIIPGLTGCAGFTRFSYTADPGTIIRLREPGHAGKTLAVLPVLDQRAAAFSDGTGNPRRTPGDRGSLALGLLPLFPAGYITKDMPENSSGFVSLDHFHFNIASDLTAAAEISLKASNLFSEVHRAAGAEQANADYLWRSRVLSTKYKGAVYSYCITYLLSPALWAIGFPYGRSENELKIVFELLDSSTGKALWSYSYEGRDSAMHWIYARMGKDVDMYPLLMKQAMNRALYNLNENFPDENP